ncbi:MAG: metalloregulator ArsR/SmtB family transcription factor [Planctomycetes bacterium]|nr:metalloregulator ArsR/SmtB family transcription factor [Planctomycetota bacterium]
MDELANIFKALGDETRLKLVALLLRHGELCVCDLEHVIGASQSKTSRHLRYLLHAGLVTDRREGVWSYYKLAGESDDRIKLLRSTLKRLLTPELTQQLETGFVSWCCAPGSNCSPAAAKSLAQAAK